MGVLNTINMKNKEYFVTEKGAKAPNKWKQGDKVSVHPVTAAKLIERGLLSEEEPKKEEPKKQKKQKDEEVI